MAKPGTDTNGERNADRRSNPSRGPLGESDLAGDVMGNNRLQGDDQENVHNQRHAVPDVKLTPDEDPVDSARMLDKDARAKAELNKGGGVHPDKSEDRE